MSLIWIFSILGITHIITGTKIFERIRIAMDVVSPNFLGILFNCPTCMGFWVGIFVSIFFPIIQISEINSYFEFLNSYWIKLFIAILLQGGIASCLNWIINVLITYVDGISTQIELKNELLVNNPLEVAKQILSEDQN